MIRRAPGPTDRDDNVPATGNQIFELFIHLLTNLYLEISSLVGNSNDRGDIERIRTGTILMFHDYVIDFLLHGIPICFNIKTIYIPIQEKIKIDLTGFYIQSLSSSILSGRPSIANVNFMKERNETKHIFSFLNLSGSDS